MLTLDRPQDANSKLPGLACSVRVRIRPNGPLVDLPPGKTTVGSSPRCNIRVQQPGVQPLHCLILNDADGPMVRRWAGETVLNGQPVEESSIGPGDCLRLALVELEIVETQGVTTAAPNKVAAPLTQMPQPAAPTPASQLTPAPSVAPIQAAAARDRFRTGRDLARTRGRRLLAALREQREVGGQLQPRVSHLEAELERAVEDRKDIAGQLQNLTSELAEARRQAVEQQVSASENEQLASQNEHLGREVCSMIQRIEQLTNELTASNSALYAANSENGAFAADIRRSADEKEQLGAQLQQQLRRCDVLSNERDEARERSNLLRAELDAAVQRETAAAGQTDHLQRELSSMQQCAADLANQNSAICRERDEAWGQCEALRSNVHALSERDSALTATVSSLERENASQREHNIELSNQLAGRSSERDEAWRQCEALRSNMHALHERESLQTENVSRLERENSSQHQQNIELSNQLAALGGERDDVWRQCEALHSNVHSLSERESVLKETVSRLERENSSHHEHNIELSNQLAGRSSERDEAWRQCEALRVNLHALSERESLLTETVSRLEHENSQWQLQIADLSNRVAVLSGERDEAWRQCESLRTDARTLSERESSLAPTVERLQHETAQQQQQVADLTSQIAALCGERDDTWRQCEALRDKVRAMSLREDEKANEIALMSGERDEARQHCEALRADVQLLKDREDALSQTVGRLEQENVALRSHGTELSEHTASLSNERDEARRQCDSLHAEVQSLTEREAAIAETARRFEQETTHRSNENLDLTSQIGALRAEYDDLRDQNEQLRAQVNALAQERATLTEAQEAANRECESLRMQLHEATSTETRQSEQLAEFVAECRRLREETDRLPQLEQQVREAVADRENTSSELYRSLLQLAEMQERDDHHAALEAAYKAVNGELEKSMQDIAALQSKIDQLSEERTAESSARESLDRRTAELIEAHQQLAYDKSTLTAQLAELGEQLEVVRGRESELTASLEAAETWRQQLADSDTRLSNLQQTVTQLQIELEDKATIEARAAAEVADRDRQIAEYTQLLAESDEAVRLLEQTAAAANEVQTEFAQARDAWRQERDDADRQRCEFERQRSQLLQRVAELEVQLAEVQTAARLAEQAAAEASATSLSSDWRNDEQLDSAPVEAHQTQFEGDVDGVKMKELQDSNSAAEFDWGNRPFESPVEQNGDLFTESGATPPESDSPWARLSDESPCSNSNGTDTDSNSGAGWPSPQPHEDAPGDWTSAAPDVNAQQLTMEPWQCAEPTLATCDASPADDTATPAPQVQRASFIDRYSRMLAEDVAGEVPLAPSLSPPPSTEYSLRGTSGLVPPQGIATSPAGDEGEESIEEYMAKLLQRVHGDVSAHTLTAANTPKQISGRVLPMTAPANFVSAPLTAPPTSLGGDIISPLGFEPSKRKSSMPAPQADLEALRALANESARRAIRRYAVRKHRRTMTTKMIVATLAGVTSLWLLLGSERWLNLQSITACVSMLVAAYWAAETCRTLLESLRVKTSDETDEEIEELSAKLRSPLPIDIDSSRAWTTQPVNTPGDETAAEHSIEE